MYLAGQWERHAEASRILAPSDFFTRPVDGTCLDMTASQVFGGKSETDHSVKPELKICTFSSARKSVPTLPLAPCGTSDWCWPHLIRLQRKPAIGQARCYPAPGDLCNVWWPHGRCWHSGGHWGNLKSQTSSAHLLQPITVPRSHRPQGTWSIAVLKIILFASYGQSYSTHPCSNLIYIL